MFSELGFEYAQGVRIEVARDKGYSERKNAKVDCTQSAVHIAIMIFQDSRTISDKERSGPPRRTIAIDGNLTKCIATRYSRSFCTKIHDARIQNSKISLTAAVKFMYLAFA